MVWTMLQTLVKVMDDATTGFFHMFLVLFGFTLAGFMGTVLSAFLVFHIYLMSKGVTTIEFCEKSSRKTNKGETSFSLGVIGNVKAALGDNVLLWFCLSHRQVAMGSPLCQKRFLCCAS